MPHCRKLLSCHLVVSGEPKGSADSSLLRLCMFCFVFFPLSWECNRWQQTSRSCPLKLSRSSCFCFIRAFIWFAAIFVRLSDWLWSIWLQRRFCFFFSLVTDGRFEWTSPFLTQRDWASEDDEWGCFKTSFSSVSPSLCFPPCMRKRNAELTGFYTPTISKWRNSFNWSSEPAHCKLDHHPINTLWSHLCVLHPGQAPMEDISLKTEIIL